MSSIHAAILSTNATLATIRLLCNPEYSIDQVMQRNVENPSGFIHLSWEAPFHQSLTKSRKFCQISAKISESTIFYTWHSFPQARFPWPTNRNGLVVFKPVRNKGTWLSSARLQFNRGPHRRFHWNILSVSFSNYGAVFILCFAAAYLSVFFLARMQE